MTRFGRRRIYDTFIHRFGAEPVYKSDGYVRSAVEAGHILLSSCVSVAPVCH